MAVRHLNNVAEFMCARPRIFTPTGTLGEVIAALSGFDYAAQIKADEKEPRRKTSASYVLDWLTEEFPPKGTTPLLAWIPGLINRYKTEEAALEAMREFASTLPEGLDRRNVAMLPPTHRAEP